MQRQFKAEDNDLEALTRDGGKVEPQQRSRRLDDAAKSVMSSRTGRRFFYELLGVCHFGRSAYSGTNEATHTVAGKQLVGEWAMDLLNNVAPEAYGLMVREAKEDETNDRRDHATASSGSDSTSGISAPDASGSQPT